MIGWCLINTHRWRWTRLGRGPLKGGFISSNTHAHTGKFDLLSGLILSNGIIIMMMINLLALLGWLHHRRFDPEKRNAGFNGTTYQSISHQCNKTPSPLHEKLEVPLRSQHPIPFRFRFPLPPLLKFTCLRNGVLSLKWLPLTCTYFHKERRRQVNRVAFPLSLTILTLLGLHFTWLLPLGNVSV